MTPGYQVGIDVGIHWRCMVCDHRQEMETPDGNEEWKFHCDKAMRMQPTWQLVAEPREPQRERKEIK